MKQIRFDFLDGIRGIAAIWVVLFHSLLFNGDGSGIKWSENFILNNIQKPLSIGHLAVSIFIVLSGFCLAIPVVNNNLKLKGGFKRYILRRAKRLIPPYYIALLLSLIIIYLFPILQVNNNTIWDNKIPITANSIISHLLIIHNLNINWIYKINGAHWSIATEWQIYWLFPLMLYLWRKSNLFLSFFLFFILSLILYKTINIAVPEFIILFFIGVVCCHLSFNSKKISNINIYASILILIILLNIFIFFPRNRIIMNLSVGLSFAYLIYSLVTYKRFMNKKIFLFESKPAQFLGKISYSMYLIHGPFLALFNLLIIKNFNLSNDYRQYLIFGFCFIFIIPISLLFYNFVEKKFLNK